MCALIASRTVAGLAGGDRVDDHGMLRMLRILRMPPWRHLPDESRPWTATLLLDARTTNWSDRSTMPSCEFRGTPSLFLGSQRYADGGRP